MLWEPVYSQAPHFIIQLAALLNRTEQYYYYDNNNNYYYYTVSQKNFTLFIFVTSLYTGCDSQYTAKHNTSLYS